MPIEQRQDPIMQLPSPPLKKAEDYLKAYNSWVYASVGAIAQEVASVKLELFKQVVSKGQPDTKQIFQHEAISLLYYVNEFYTQYELLEGTQAYLDLVGEAFWAKLRDSKGNPVELWLMRPDWVHVKPDAKNYIKGYSYYPGGVQVGEGKFFKREDVIHFKYFNPMNPYRGKGAVQAGAMAIDTDQFSAEWNRNFFFNSALPDTIVSTDAKLGDEAVERFIKSWRAKFGGRQNAHKMAVLTGGKWDVHTLNQTPNEMAFADQRRMMRDDILATFKVPKTVLGITEDVNKANAEATTRAFMERVITPRMQKLVMVLNEFYLKEWGDDLFFNFVDPSPEDVELKLKVYKSALGGEGGVPWMTINEVRQNESLEPLEGGDDLYLPFSFMKQGDSSSDEGEVTPANDDQSKQVVLRGKALKPKPKKYMVPIPPAKLKDIRKRAVIRDVKHSMAKLISKVMEFKESNEERKDEFWKRMVVKTDMLEIIMVDKLRPLFLSQRDFVMGELEATKGMRLANRKKDIDPSNLIFDSEQEAAEWVKQFKPFITNVIQDKGREILDFLGISAELDLATQTAVLFLKEEGLSFAKDVNETTKQQLIKSLATGLAQEESIGDLRKRIEEIFEAAVGHRSEMIARTEILRATNFATYEGYKQSGVVDKKVWYTAMDERVCSICGPLHGKSVSIDGKFGSEKVEFPPIHPGCRCTIIAGILD